MKSGPLISWQILPRDLWVPLFSLSLFSSCHILMYSHNFPLFITSLSFLDWFFFNFFYVPSPTLILSLSLSLILIVWFCLRFFIGGCLVVFFKILSMAVLLLLLLLLAASSVTADEGKCLCFPLSSVWMNVFRDYAVNVCFQSVSSFIFFFFFFFFCLITYLAWIYFNHFIQFIKMAS